MTKNEFYYNVYETDKGSLFIDKAHKIHLLSDIDFSHSNADEIGFSVISHHEEGLNVPNSVFSADGKIGYWKDHGANKDKKISRIDFVTNEKEKHIHEANIEKIKLYLEDHKLIEITKGSDIKKLTEALADNFTLELVDNTENELSYYKVS